MCTILKKVSSKLCALSKHPDQTKGLEHERVHDPSAVIEAQVMIFCTVNKQCHAVKNNRDNRNVQCSAKIAENRGRLIDLTVDDNRVEATMEGSQK